MLASNLISIVPSSSNSIQSVKSDKEKKGRFTIEHLNFVRCTLISDNPSLGLLRKATTKAVEDIENNTMTALLRLKTKLRNDIYTMEVTEKILSNSSTSIFSSSPHVLLFILCSRNNQNTIDNLRKLENESSQTDIPVVILALKHPSEDDYQINKLLKHLSAQPHIFRCIQATAIAKTTLRYCLSLSLLAARPFLALMSDEEDLKIEDQTIHDSIDNGEGEDIKRRMRTESMSNGEKIQKPSNIFKAASTNHLSMPCKDKHRFCDIQ